ncbi:MAG: DUF3365 domain-containing protein [Gemmatimonadetes bacterium]|nr:DUF3365 domain-containing protein [Gemmatimonadota bacterium]MCC6771423.1 DUF3365 domain-containing protein [Gemmatimonadaceae bacterium]
MSLTDPQLAGIRATATRHAVYGLVVLSGLSFAAAIVGAQGATRAGAPNVQLARAVAEVEQLDALRSTLARTFAAGGVSATDSTFDQVCKPVKMQAMSVAKANGWSIAQLAERYRNPENALDAEAARVFGAMQRDPEMMGQWVHATRDGSTGVRYFRRITVESSCLACHGARAERPAFVQQRYPADKAYGFSAGDLRGVYSVFLPDSIRRK